MEKIDLQEFIWVQKYRPQTVNDLIIPERIRNIFNSIIKSKNIPNLLLISKCPGTGKCLRGTEEIEICVSDEVFFDMKKKSTFNIMYMNGLEKLNLRKIKITLENLFKYLDAINIDYDTFYNNDKDIFIPTPDGDYSKLLATVLKKDFIVRVLTKNNRIIECGSKHILIDNCGNQIFAKDSLGKKLLCVDGEFDEVIKVENLNIEEPVYDISIPAPHLYITPNGLVHHNTSLAKALVNDLDAEYIFLNGSEIGIDVFRTTIPDFASTKSLDGKKKVIIIDEFDRGNAVDKQKILRPMMEQFSKNCTFIITANDSENIIDPLKSRCETIEFANYNNEEEKSEVIKQLYQRLVFILKNENIKVENAQIIKELVNKFFPDIRQLIGAIQKYGRSGVIDTGILTSIQNDKIDSVIDALKNKNFSELKIYAQKYSLNYVDFLRELQESLYPQIEPHSIPDLLTIIGDSNRQYNQVADLQIELIYMLCQLMLTLQFK